MCVCVSDCLCVCARVCVRVCACFTLHVPAAVPLSLLAVMTMVALKEERGSSCSCSRWNSTPSTSRAHALQTDGRTDERRNAGWTE